MSHFWSRNESLLQSQWVTSGIVMSHFEVISGVGMSHFWIWTLLLKSLLVWFFRPRILGKFAMSHRKVAMSHQPYFPQFTSRETSQWVTCRILAICNESPVLREAVLWKDTFQNENGNIFMRAQMTLNAFSPVVIVLLKHHNDIFSTWQITQNITKMCNFM